MFHYISGKGAARDSRFMWARVKAEAETELIDLVGAVCWRPAFIDGAASASAPRAVSVAAARVSLAETDSQSVRQWGRHRPRDVAGHEGGSRRTSDRQRGAP